MLIELTCPKCGAKFRLNNEVAGPDWTCGGCGMHFSIPQYTAPAEALPPVASLPQVAPLEIMRWEGFRVSTEIASWGATLGVVGSLSYGLGQLLFRVWIDRVGTYYPSSFSLQLLLEALLLGVVTTMLALGFHIAAAGVCRVSRVATDGADWGWNALMAFVLFIVLMLALPILPYQMRLGIDVGTAVIKGIIWLMLCSVFAGHACLASGFGRVAERLGSSGSRRSAAWYCGMLLAFALWMLLYLFVFTESSGPVGDPFFGGALGASGADWEQINMIAITFLSALQFYWFGRIARQTGVVVRKHQVSIA